MVSPTLVATGATILFAILSTLIGLAYRNLRRRVRNLEEDTNTRSDEHNGLTDKVDTLWSWAFGVPDDETDGGLSAEIQDGFDMIEEDVDDLKKTQETYHEVEMSHLERLVNELHDEDEIDIDRKDILQDDD